MGRSRLFRDPWRPAAARPEFLVRGRADLAAKVAIVTESFVRTFWNDGRDPIGRRFRLRTIDGPEYEVVGVVNDYKVETVGEKPTPYIHYAIGQRAFSGEVLMARTAGDAGALVAAMKREILTLEPNAVFIEATTMEGQVDATLLPAILAAQTGSLVGIVATILAAIGLYGVIAYAVARRTREIGIRMALGAAPGGVVAMVMRQGLTVTAFGVLTRHRPVVAGGPGDFVGAVWCQRLRSDRVDVGDRGAAGIGRAGQLRPRPQSGARGSVGGVAAVVSCDRSWPAPADPALQRRRSAFRLKSEAARSDIRPTSSH